MRSLAFVALLLTQPLAFAQLDSAALATAPNRQCLNLKPGAACIIAPVATYQPDPPYTKQARKKKRQGDVGMTLVVGADGIPHNIKVTRSLGLGLDEEAVKSVQTWKFQPGTKDGKPVPMQVTVSVSFHLL